MSTSQTSRNKDLTYVDLVLKKVEDTSDRQRRNLLNLLAKLLCEDPLRRETFYKLKGVPRLIKCVWQEDKQTIVSTLCPLGFCACNHAGNQAELTREDVFSTVDHILRKARNNDIKFITNAMFFLCYTVKGNPKGQTMVRTSGCLKHVTQVFSFLTQQAFNKNKKEVLRELGVCWETWCMCISMCISSPQNSKNQAITAPIISKSILFLAKWVKNVTSLMYLNKCVNDIISMLPHILINNSCNQYHFAASSGIHVIVKGLFVLEQLQNATYDFDPIVSKFVQLLNIAMLDNKDSCSLISTLQVIPLLLRILSRVDKKYKLSPLAALASLMDSCEDNRNIISKENGYETIMKATECFDSKSDAKMLVRYMCELDPNKEEEETAPTPAATPTSRLKVYPAKKKGIRRRPSLEVGVEPRPIGDRPRSAVDTKPHSPKRSSSSLVQKRMALAALSESNAPKQCQPSRGHRFIAYQGTATDASPKRRNVHTKASSSTMRSKQLHLRTPLLPTRKAGETYSLYASRKDSLPVKIDSKHNLSFPDNTKEKAMPLLSPPQPWSSSLTSPPLPSSSSPQGHPASDHRTDVNDHYNHYDAIRNYQHANQEKNNSEMSNKMKQMMEMKKRVDDNALMSIVAKDRGGDNYAVKSTHSFPGRDNKLMMFSRKHQWYNSGVVMDSQTCNPNNQIGTVLRYSKQELNNLTAGIKKYGYNFAAIRRSFKFHPSRTPKDLYLKWRSCFLNQKMKERGHQFMPGQALPTTTPIASPHKVTARRPGKDGHPPFR